MKNYFESKIRIIPFDKVEFIEFSSLGAGQIIDVKTNGYYTPVPCEQLQDYKNWLKLKQQALVDRVKPIITIPEKSVDTETVKKILNEIDKNCAIQEFHNKPEITEEFLLSITDIFDISRCFFCIHEDNEESCEPCEFSVYQHKLAELNRKWREKK